jgi:opacity protein-like surface antigen
MKTKLRLLASSAIAALSLAAPAYASSDIYVSVFGGGNWQVDDKFHAATAPTVSADTLTFNPNSETGFIVGGAVGYSFTQWVPGLRAEAEVAYRENHVKGNWVSNIGTPTAFSSGTLDYDHSTFSVLANAWYDFQIADVHPYLGGGIGWARTRLNGDFIDITAPLSKPLVRAHDDGFAWQLGGGIKFDISPSMQLGVGYRYFKGPDVTVGSGFAANSAVGNVNDENHSVLAELTFGL